MIFCKYYLYSLIEKYNIQLSSEQKDEVVNLIYKDIELTALKSYKSQQEKSKSKLKEKFNMFKNKNKNKSKILKFK